MEPLFKWLARIMDEFIRVPGTKFKFGLDPLIGLLPGLGDTGSALVSAFALIQAARLGVPKILLARMSLNILINELIGIVPVVGDAFSFWFKSNARNYQIIKRPRGRSGRCAPERLDFCHRGSGGSRRDRLLRITGQSFHSPADRENAGWSLNHRAPEVIRRCRAVDRVNALSRFPIALRKRIEAVRADAFRQLSLLRFIGGKGGDAFVFPSPKN